MELLTKASNAFAEVGTAVTRALPPPPNVSTITASGWFAIMVLTIVANTLITIYLYPSQKPNYWWLPGAWIWFKLNDIFFPVDPNSKDPNKRRKFFTPPRIA